MNMINKRLEELIEKYKITKTSNIIFGTNYIKPKLIIPTPWKPYIKYTNLSLTHHQNFTKRYSTKKCQKNRTLSHPIKKND